MSTQPISRAGVRGLASGIFVLAFFATYWAMAGAGIAFSGVYVTVALIVSIVIALVFFGFAVYLIVQARRLPKEVSEEEAVYWRGTGWKFGLVFLTEFVLIGVANIVLSILNKQEFAIPLTALIVGLHFLPLARLFRVNMYYGVGILMSLLAIVAIIAVLFNSGLSLAILYGWSMVVAFGCALILWVTDIELIRQGMRLLQSGFSQRTAL